MASIYGIIGGQDGFKRILGILEQYFERSTDHHYLERMREPGDLRYPRSAVSQWNETGVMSASVKRLSSVYQLYVY